MSRYTDPCQQLKKCILFNVPSTAPFSNTPFFLSFSPSFLPLVQKQTQKMSDTADKALSVIMIFAPTIGYFDQVIS
jgi:hypothetical protein